MELGFDVAKLVDGGDGPLHSGSSGSAKPGSGSRGEGAGLWASLPAYVAPAVNVGPPIVLAVLRCTSILALVPHPTCLQALAAGAAAPPRPPATGWRGLCPSRQALLCSTSFTCAEER